MDFEFTDNKRWWRWCFCSIGTHFQSIFFFIFCMPIPSTILLLLLLLALCTQQKKKKTVFSYFLYSSFNFILLLFCSFAFAFVGFLMNNEAENNVSFFSPFFNILCMKSSRIQLLMKRQKVTRSNVYGKCVQTRREEVWIKLYSMSNRYLQENVE